LLGLEFVNFHVPLREALLKIIKQQHPLRFFGIGNNPLVLAVNDVIHLLKDYLTMTFPISNCSCQPSMSFTASRSSSSSCRVAAIFSCAKSLSSTPWTSDHWLPPELRSG